MDKTRKTILILIFLLIISALAHGVNMFGYPYYENDEGTYMSQAWSLLRFGKLAPYTYWYDHAPAGWFLIAGWVKLTGGFFTFGTSVNSGRVLMLILHLGISALLFWLANRMSKRLSAGIIAVLIFSLSPLALYYQRRVLLDNIMIFFVFCSLAFLFFKNIKLRFVSLSAVLFGIAILSKENAIFFIPAFLYTLYSRSHSKARMFSIGVWLSIVFSVVSVYFLYAFLKGELFPANDTNRVSLIDTLNQQFSRGSNLPFWDSRSDLVSNLRDWLAKDSVTILLGGFATLVGAVVSIWVRYMRLPVLLAILFWIFLARGKIVLGFYIVPFIPLLSLNIGMLIDLLVNKIKQLTNSPKVDLVFNLAIVILALLIASRSTDLHTKNETANQIASVNWIKQNVEQDAVLVMDDSLYVDLHDQRFPGDRVFPNAEWSWKVEKDPQIRQAKLQNDWQNIDYIILSHEILRQIKDSDFDFVKNAFDNSYLVADWRTNSSSHINIEQYISTNGDWNLAYKLLDRDTITQKRSWQDYKNNIHSYGQVIDPLTQTTTSALQGQTMYQSVMMDDQETFRGVWKWTKDHFQYRTTDRLLSSVWKNDSLVDADTRSSGDVATAVALIAAYKKWHYGVYLDEAKKLISDIWKQEVVRVGDSYILLAGSNAQTPNGYLIDFSSVEAHSIRSFSDFDPVNPWSELADSWEDLSNQYGKQSGILVMDKVNGSITATDPELLSFEH